MKKAKCVFMLLSGAMFLASVCAAYIPLALKNGFYEFELTFLSNTIVGLLFFIGGCVGLSKGKELPQGLYLCGILLLQLVFLICMTFINEFNFKGGFFFLHVVNPICATVVLFVCTSCSEMPRFKALLSALIFPVIYLVYVITYGYLSGSWIYGIINIPQKGVVFVTLLVLAAALGILILEWAQYKLSFISTKKKRS